MQQLNIYNISARNIEINLLHCVTAAILSIFLAACSNAKISTLSKSGLIEIFDGKSLKGWEGDPAYWKVEGGAIVGEVMPATVLKRNTFIIYRGVMPDDFDLIVSFKISAAGNSGINYRSVELPDLPFALKGYQADFDGANKYTGQNYEERGRTFLARIGEVVTINDSSRVTVAKNIIERDSLIKLIKPGDWNEMHIVAKGNHLMHFVNDVLISDVTDNDIAHRKLSGLLGVQVHVGPPMKVAYKNFRLRKI